MLLCRVTPAQLLTAAKTCAVFYLISLQPKAESQSLFWIHEDSQAPQDAQVTHWRLDYRCPTPQTRRRPRPPFLCPPCLWLARISASYHRIRWKLRQISLCMKDASSSAAGTHLCFGLSLQLGETEPCMMSCFLSHLLRRAAALIGRSSQQQPRGGCLAGLKGSDHTAPKTSWRI